MNQHLTVITGASRGLGLAMSRQLLAQSHVVVAIARKRTELPVPPGGELLGWSLDLAEPLAAARHLEDWLAKSEVTRWASVTLINNAGVVSPPGRCQARRVRTCRTPCAWASKRRCC